ncbi:Putative SWR1-complex protein [Septoria linicola]|uniref:SWR1-complex protein n=1 Tax=Septoria linicola TaxID=215465 RepID=A0A9Q9AHH7_9PEZI|nr:putative SWR1-complex protein [Septoria linicola]USW47784.1 Putative SWR1-complex protein [Septoria linicola]
MATVDEPGTVPRKKGPGRPRKESLPAAKKQKTTVAATPTHGGSAAQSPAANSPAPERQMSRLVSKVVESKPLPSLPEPQPLRLSDDEYQSIAASAVLATSLEQSRLRWISDGIFERYWVKPETGKNAKPPPPKNPDAKWMKSRGECRMRIEPHLFVADMYVEERTKPPPAVPKQQPNQQYRLPQQYGQQQSQQYQGRPLPPVLPPATGHAGSGPLPKPPAPQRPQPPGPRMLPTGSAASSTPPNAQKPDPVISMLATRASSNPELKALMKEVATGNATQDQLKVFQKHIDELTTIITKQKQDEEDTATKAHQQANAIQYDAAAPAKSASMSEAALQQAPRSSPYPAAPQAALQYGQQSSWTASPPPSTNLPVILAFKDTGATEDRFLFPQNSILEALSPQHLLASFIVTRKGGQAVDVTGLDPSAQYWQPVTIMIEVAYGREELLNCIRRWVKPADEVRKHMEEVMQHSTRVPEQYLAMRLPFKSTATTDDDLSKEATPLVEDRGKPRPKAVKKATSISKLNADIAKRQSGTVSTPENASTPDVAGQSTTVSAKTPHASTEHAVEPDDRPRRATRKSVRISEA